MRLKQRRLGVVETKVLIAIDMSENSLTAVDYVGRMLHGNKDAQFTMLHVIKEPSSDIMPDDKERQMHVQLARDKSLSMMEKVARRLIAQNIPESHIHIKIQICRKQVSVSDLILSEQKKGGHETIVVGRRGVSKREEFLFGSVSNSVMREAKGCTVWVVE